METTEKRIDDLMMEALELRRLESTFDVIAHYDSNALSTYVISPDVGRTWGVFWTDGPRWSYEGEESKEAALLAFANDLKERMESGDVA